ncbi:MAG: short-chain fatty acyl-CoA regulator family protein [Chromatiales bacterium]|nr:short-chain fatty acyl-CoA regulator family protein [Chromatiales bacterium]
MSHLVNHGRRVRKLREQRGLTQAALAEKMAISPSYLNQIENDTRPLNKRVLTKLELALGVDFTDWAEDEDRRANLLREALNDPLFRGADIPTQELREAVSASPRVADRFLQLFRAHQRLQNDYQTLAESIAGEERIKALHGAQFPYEDVRDFFYRRNNHIEAIDAAAENLFEEQNFNIDDLQSDLANYLLHHHNITVKLASENSGNLQKRYDAENRILYIGKPSSPSRRAFHIAHQIGLLIYGKMIDREIENSDLASLQARSICRVGLANYFAGALLMPYTRFLNDAKELRYDIERLCGLYGNSFEQVCHRLSTLQRPGDKGVPFYFVRVDIAGNISKRQSATSFHFARLGGVCPLWNVHEAFSSPGKILRQLAEMPDGKTYLCLARTVYESGGNYLKPERKFAIGLGCEIRHANQLVYATGLDLENPEAVEPIGVSCRVCERPNCPQRAFPPLSRRLTISENARSAFPYPFEKSEDQS